MLIAGTVLSTTNAKSHIRRIVQDEILNLIPVVKEATKAREKYYTTPSTKNGSRRQEADDEAKNAINSASQIIWSTWAKDFKVLITQDELIGMICDELVDLDH